MAWFHLRRLVATRPVGARACWPTRLALLAAGGAHLSPELPHVSHHVCCNSRLA